MVRDWAGTSGDLSSVPCSSTDSLCDLRKSYSALELTYAARVARPSAAGLSMSCMLAANLEVQQ